MAPDTFDLSKLVYYIVDYMLTEKRTAANECGWLLGSSGRR